MLESSFWPGTAPNQVITPCNLHHCTAVVSETQFLPHSIADLPVPHTYLRGNIVRSPTESAGLCISKHVLLAHPKVSNLDVPLVVQEDIVQLQVSVEEEKKTPFFKV